MNAIELLEGQHREVERLFSECLEAEGGDRKRALFNELADLLAIHTTIEERVFYPSMKQRDTEDLLLESVEEHLAIKRLMADLLSFDDVESPTFDAKLKVLEDEVSHHVEEEEDELFPKVEAMVEDEDYLEAVGQEMTALMTELMEQGSPRSEILHETERAASI